MKNPDPSRRNPVNRRTFLQSAALAAPLILSSPLRGNSAPNNRLQIGAIGVGNRSRAVNERALASFEDVRIVACADPIRDHRERFTRVINEGYGGKVCRPYRDYRELLARPDIDAVTICAPDHWHVSLAAAALRAGKDIYLEKPLSLAIAWSQRLRNLFAGQDIVFQFGTQQRSYGTFQRAVNLVRNGYIGEIRQVDAWCPEMQSRYANHPENPFGRTEPEPIPEGIDFDLWTGPAPLRPYNWDRVDNFYHISDYCLGFLGNWGVHPLDIAQWGLDMDHSGPVSYEGIGTLVPKVGLYDTVENWDLHCHYANGVKLRFMSQELAEPVVRRYHYTFRNHGTVFHGTEGWVGVDRVGLYTSDRNRLRDVRFKSTDTLVGYPEALGLKGEPKQGKFYQAAGHQRNFVDCVRSRQATINPLEAAIRVDTIVNLADICLRTKTPFTWDPAKEEIPDATPAMTAMLDRPMREPYGV